MNPEVREDKLIFFGSNEMYKILNYSKEYFIDITFRIIPKKSRPIKMMTVSSKDGNNNTIICLFVFYKYQDKITYDRIFNFLKENYNFIPKIVHHDYEYALYSSLDNSKIFGEKILLAFCYFHFIKAIVDKMIKLKIQKGKLNKQAYEVIKNIEIISFIKQTNLKNYIKF